jgi:hypothetical protein
MSCGDYDSLIRQRAEAWRLHRPIRLEFRHEMDRPNLQWVMHGPKNYIAAWDHIRAVFASWRHQRGLGLVPDGWFRNGRAHLSIRGQRGGLGVADIYSVSSLQTLQDSAHSSPHRAKHTPSPC